MPTSITYPVAIEDLADSLSRVRLAEALGDRGVMLIGASGESSTSTEASDALDYYAPSLLAVTTYFGSTSDSTSRTPDISYYNKKWGARMIQHLATAQTVSRADLDSVWKFVRLSGVRQPEHRLWSFGSRPPMDGTPNLGARAVWHLLSYRPRHLFLTGFDFYLTPIQRRGGLQVGQSGIRRVTFLKQQMCDALARHNVFAHLEFFGALRDNRLVICSHELHSLLNEPAGHLARRLEKNYWSPIEPAQR